MTPNFKYLYAVGDSFTYGDDLLKHEFETCPTAPRFKGITDPYELTHSMGKGVVGRPDLIDLQKSLTFSGKVAAHYNVPLTNFAQSGASMDGIEVQSRAVLFDIRNRGISETECLVLIGITSHLRKLFLQTELVNSSNIASLPIAASSIFLANPEYSYYKAQPLAKMLSKEYSNDQSLYDFILTLSNIANSMHRANIQCRFINIWNNDFALAENKNMNWLINAELSEFDTLSLMWPPYPNSLTSIFHTLNRHKSHPPKEAHAEYAKYLIEQINNDTLLTSKVTDSVNTNLKVTTNDTMVKKMVQRS